MVVSVTCIPYIVHTCIIMMTMVLFNWDRIPKATRWCVTSTNPAAGERWLFRTFPSHTSSWHALPLLPWRPSHHMFSTCPTKYLKNCLSSTWQCVCLCVWCVCVWTCPCVRIYGAVCVVLYVCVCMCDSSLVGVCFSTFLMSCVNLTR